LLKALCLGVIEGVTEWLPISSTGHMILADRVLKLGDSPEFFELFLVVIQLGAVLAVAVLYRRTLFPLELGHGVRPRVKHDCLTLWGKCLTACVPAAVIGLLFDDKINELFYNHFTVAVTLIFYGALFIVIEVRNRARCRFDDVRGLTYLDALFIGLFQVLSLIPGTSRSGATILGAMLIGASRGASAEFSFFLALPVMAGAGLLKLVKFGLAFTPQEIALILAGAASAFLVSLAAIRFLIGFVRKHDFKAFGIYRIVLGAAVLAAYFIFPE
jgi:undecaprenyl-diphosphatase